jgi:cell division septum initiation protein DivIVA
MSSNLAPLLVGLAVVGLSMVVIGGIHSMRRLFGRVRSGSRGSWSARYDGWLADQDWMSHGHDVHDEREEAPVRHEPEVGSPEGVVDLRHLPVLEEAERRAQEILARAADRAASVLGESEAEAERRAQESLANAESLLREGAAEAERRANEITEAARTQARKLVEKAELDARAIVAAAERERGRLVDDLARQRALVEETRTRLSTFLVDVLEEVDGVPAPDSTSMNVRDLTQAREMRTSAGGDA